MEATRELDVLFSRHLFCIIKSLRLLERVVLRIEAKSDYTGTLLGCFTIWEPQIYKDQFQIRPSIIVCCFMLIVKGFYEFIVLRW